MPPSCSVRLDTKINTATIDAAIASTLPEGEEKGGEEEGEEGEGEEGEGEEEQTLLLFSSARGDGARLGAQNRSLYLDGASEPFTLRAVLYSPTPWGYDDDLHYHTAVYESDYEAIFARDLDLIVSLGANAVRIHGFLGVALALLVPGALAGTPPVALRVPC